MRIFSKLLAHSKFLTLSPAKGEDRSAGSSASLTMRRETTAPFSMTTCSVTAGRPPGIAAIPFAHAASARLSLICSRMAA
jgi:hypothetical protein